MKLRILILLCLLTPQIYAQVNPENLNYPPIAWKSAPPADCPFPASKEITGITLLGVKSGFHFGDTWYPTWANDGNLYSPWTDGGAWRLDGSYDTSQSGGEVGAERTGHGVIEGDDPLSLKVYSLGISFASPNPYHGRYPCGSLIYEGVWYYGTYCLDPAAWADYGGQRINWPWMGPFVGFRTSTDYGRTWTETPLTPEKPLFGETGINGYPVKIGAPHFVDFGKNLQYSPDGKAYLVAHGADTTDTKYRFWNDSWITGDQIYLTRVIPSLENMNDASKYEFYAGTDPGGKPVWTNDFKKIRPLLEWNNNMGCVTMTYNTPLKKYLMCVTDGGNTCAKMHTYILESNEITGPWKLVTYLKDFGEQAYFVTMPSKFISSDGRTAWLWYSANFAKSTNGMRIKENPPGSHYGLVMQKISLNK